MLFLAVSVLCHILPLTGHISDLYIQIGGFRP